MNFRVKNISPNCRQVTYTNQCRQFKFLDSVSFFRFHQWNCASPNQPSFFSRPCSRRTITHSAVQWQLLLQLALTQCLTSFLTELHVSVWAAFISHHFLKLTSFHQTAENKCCCLLIAAAEQQGKFQFFLSHLHVIFGNTEEKEKWNWILDDNKKNIFSTLLRFS